MASDTTARAGSATVAVSGLRAATDRAARAVGPVVRDRLHAHLSSILDTARRLWPVRTGRSRGGLVLRESASAERVRETLANDIPYAGDVHRVREDAPAWEVLVVGPVVDSRRAVELALGSDVERAAQRAVDAQ